MTPKATNMLMAFIAASCVMMLASVLYVLFNNAIPDTNRENVSMVLGGLLQNFGIVVGYFFASSRASASKDATIDALTARVPPHDGSDAMRLQAGEQATAKATESGTIIEKEATP